MAQLTRSIKEADADGAIEICEYEPRPGIFWVNITVFGPNGGAKGAVSMPREKFAKMIEQFWRGEIAFEFENEEGG